MSKDERLAQLQAKHALTREECIEYLMLRGGVDRDFAEEWFAGFAATHDPIVVQ
jgi:hypothetical protein